MTIDLRSDTITRPTAAMRDAMIHAPVGDDVFREDPTVNALQDHAAQMFGMEAGLYCSSGTQTNQIAITVHARPGDEVICSNLAHIYIYEGGGIALNAGASVRLLEGDRGRISAEDVQKNINADDAHYPRTSLVCLENTVNKGGGSIYDINEILRIREVCKKHNLKLHLDGARVFNALVEQNISYREFGQLFDSISICLSKGLGAPVGSVLIGTKDFIYHAHRRRKSFGGGMRQAGFIAAAGLYALQHHIERLKEDHRRAQELISILKLQPWVKASMPVDTNIILFEVRDDLQPRHVTEALAKQDIHCFTVGDRMVRMVTHIDFTDDHLNLFAERMRNISL